MHFTSLVLKNLFRRPARAFLALLGIALGITTVVALGVILGGFKSSSAQIVQLGGADFFVAQKGAADLSFSTVPEETITKVREHEGVGDAFGAILHITRAGSNPFFFMVGIEPEGLAAHPPPLVAGRVPAPGVNDEIMLGTAAASLLDASLGSTVTLADNRFTVVGIFETGAKIIDNGGQANLAKVQEIAARQGFVTAVYVFLEPGASRATVTAGIERDIRNTATITGIGDYGKVDQGIRIIDAVELAVSVLAVGIGAIGVMNTMIMSVLERTREIGIMRAVGWSGSRVLRLILLESIILCLAAAVVGTLLGVLASEAAVRIPAVSHLLTPKYDPAIFIRALVVALGVAISGAIYPAVRAIRLQPLEALRYE